MNFSRLWYQIGFSARIEAKRRFEMHFFRQPKLAELYWELKTIRKGIIDLAHQAGLLGLHNESWNSVKRILWRKFNADATYRGPKRRDQTEPSL